MARRGSFHGRFDIDIGLDEAKQKFVERAHNRIFQELSIDDFSEFELATYRSVADALGRRPELHRSVSTYVGDDFLDVLKAIEGMYAAIPSTEYRYETLKRKLNAYVDHLLNISELDLGIRWKPPYFQRAGAEELDRVLVNDTLVWLRKKGYEAVAKPFEKGLRHLMESQKRPELRADVITDMYESLDALAKKATGNDLDLAKNNDFVDAVKASDEYKPMLKNYIGYANRFRHAVKAKQPRPSLSERETESFVYLTGLFIRLAMPE